MLTKAQFIERFGKGFHLLDGATGSQLMAMGMPAGSCTEEWILYNPEPLVSLQRAYAKAGSEIIYAPTLRAQPEALKKHGLDGITENINELLAALSRKAAPGCEIAGDISTVKGCIDTSDHEAMVSAYRRQIRGLIDGGADMLAAETLLYEAEALAVLEAASIEGAGAVMCTFTMARDGRLFDGRDAGEALRRAAAAGAAAVGINCVAISEETPGLVKRLSVGIDVPFVCKPNAGRPYTDENGKKRYPVDGHRFAEIMKGCVSAGAGIIGGCCGTGPEYIAAMRDMLSGLA